MNRQLEALQVKLIFAEHAIIDATMIERAARLRRIAKVIADDRNEDAVNCEDVDVDVEYERNKDA